MSNQPESEARVPVNQQEEPPYPPIGYAWYVVAILMLIYVLSFIDRQIFSLLVAPIQKDLGATDTQMGLLMGTYFAVFYTFFGIPLGRLADVKSRRSIIAVGIAVWSLMTAASGVARSYAQLAFCRFGVGIGEAALSPAAYSLIVDYFPRRLLATAISVYGAGIYIGSGMAFLLGGLVIKYVSGQESVDLPIAGTIRPWQLVFLTVGIPGLLFSLVTYTIKEPFRRGSRKRIEGQSEGHSVAEVTAYVSKNGATFFCHNMAFGLLALSGYAGISWIPTFFARVHLWDIPRISVWYGTIMMVFGTAGIIYGGRLADQLAARGYVDAKMRCGLIAALIGIPFGIAYPLVADATVAMLLLAPLVFAIAMPFGAAPAAMQEMMPAAMRSQASAIYLFVVNLVGIGCGALAVGLLTDKVFQDKNMVGYSLLVVGTISGLLAALLLYIGLKPFCRSIEYLKEWEVQHHG